MRRLGLAAVCLAVMVLPAAADAHDPKDPEELLKLKWDAVVEILDCNEITQEAKRHRIIETVTPVFDFTLMSKLALGRQYWPRLTSQQRTEFAGLFEERLKASYSDKIALYEGQEAVFKPAVRKEQFVRIPMQLVSENQKIDLLYKFHETNGCWKIYDIEIQGVSLILTYRSQFEDILKNGTFEDLVSRLREPASDQD